MLDFHLRKSLTLLIIISSDSGGPFLLMDDRWHDLLWTNNIFSHTYAYLTNECNNLSSIFFFRSLLYIFGYDFVFIFYRRIIRKELSWFIQNIPVTRMFYNFIRYSLRSIAPIFESNLFRYSRQQLGSFLLSSKIRVAAQKSTDSSFESFVRICYEVLVDFNTERLISDTSNFVMEIVRVNNVETTTRKWIDYKKVLLRWYKHFTEIYGRFRY